MAETKSLVAVTSVQPGTAFALAQEQGYIDCKLASKTQITHDSFIYTFELPSPDMQLGLPLGQHILFEALIKSEETPEGEIIKRPYTPISKIDQQGSFDLLLKVYRVGVHPRFPLGGRMSQYVDNLQIGDTIKVKGPKGKITYFGNGTLRLKEEEETRILRNIKHIGMIAGGTGIAPMYQLIKWINENPEDQTQISLLFANVSENDILLKNELDKIAETGRIKLFYTVDKASSDNWNGFLGYVTEEMIQKTMPPPSTDGSTIITFSGPFPLNQLLFQLLVDLGYPPEQFFKY